MKSSKYIENVLRTESGVLNNVRSRLKDDQALRLLHAALGAATESGELVDVLKKHLFYGREIDWVNIDEELGDILWYVAVAVDVLNQKGFKVSFESIMEKNIAKLKTRYGEKFSSKAAIHRNLKAERKILETPTKRRKK